MIGLSRTQWVRMGADVNADLRASKDFLAVEWSQVNKMLRTMMMIRSCAYMQCWQLSTYPVTCSNHMFGHLMSHVTCPVSLLLHVPPSNMVASLPPSGSSPSTCSLLILPSPLSSCCSSSAILFSTSAWSSAIFAYSLVV